MQMALKGEAAGVAAYNIEVALKGLVVGGSAAHVVAAGASRLGLDFCSLCHH
jgi:hypothetical protein